MCGDYHRLALPLPPLSWMVPVPALYRMLSMVLERLAKF